MANKFKYVPGPKQMCKTPNMPIRSISFYLDDYNTVIKKIMIWCLNILISIIKGLCLQGKQNKYYRVFIIKK